MKKLILILGCLISQLTFAQQTDSAMVKKIVDEVLTSGTAYENLRKLCKQVGARLSGSPQYLKAVTLTSGMFREMGADTTYLQECMVPHWVRGEKEKGSINYKDGKKFDLHLTALGNSVGTGNHGVKAQVVEVNTMAQLHALGNSLKGKIVFFNFPMNQTYIETNKAYGESGVSRIDGPAYAGKYGALGAVVRSLAINLNDFPHTGTTVYNDSFPKIPAVAISTNDAELLSRQLKNGKVNTVYFRTTSKMLPDEKGYNVIGELRGTEFPHEIITVGGHLDSWDLAEGAHDDGTGVMQSMEVIRTFIALHIKPKRTIRAVLFVNEENGGKGAAKYLEKAKTNNEKHVMALESDAGGFAPRGFGLSMNPAQKNKISGWAPLFRPLGVYDFSEGDGGSDIDPLKAIGTALIGYSPDNQRYFDIHHAATDVFEAVSRRELLLGAANIAALVYLVDEYGL
ncbi:M28 family peptidase [soil metagenome]